MALKISGLSPDAGGWRPRVFTVRPIGQLPPKIPLREGLRSIEDCARKLGKPGATRGEISSTASLIAKMGFLTFSGLSGEIDLRKLLSASALAHYVSLRPGEKYLPETVIRAVVGRLGVDHGPTNVATSLNIVTALQQVEEARRPGLAADYLKALLKTSPELDMRKRASIIITLARSLSAAGPDACREFVISVSRALLRDGLVDVEYLAVVIGTNLLLIQVDPVDLVVDLVRSKSNADRAQLAVAVAERQYTNPAEQVRFLASVTAKLESTPKGRAAFVSALVQDNTDTNSGIAWIVDITKALYLPLMYPQQGEDVTSFVIALDEGSRGPLDSFIITMARIFDFVVERMNFLANVIKWEDIYSREDPSAVTARVCQLFKSPTNRGIFLAVLARKMVTGLDDQACFVAVNVGEIYKTNPDNLGRDTSLVAAAREIARGSAAEGIGFLQKVAEILQPGGDFGRLEAAYLAAQSDKQFSQKVAEMLRPE